MGIADCTELRLSSAFEHLSGEPKLELVVTVFNVNEGHNAELMQHCSMLKEYAQYVAKVRHYAAYMQLNQAVERAVNECIREGIGYTLSDSYQYGISPCAGDLW